MIRYRAIAAVMISFIYVLWSISPALADPPPVSSSVSISVSTLGPTGNLRMTGHALPNGLVTYLHQGVVAGTSIANSVGFFDKTLTSLQPGVHTFSIYATDTNGWTTLTLSFDANIISGSTITLSGFLLPPTIGVGKTTLKRPETQSADGYARTDASVTAFFSNNGISKQDQTNSDGAWDVTVPETFGLGAHSVQALVQDQDGGQSVLSQSRPFTVVLSADLNVDNLINLTDFSILMFNYGRGDFPNKAADINDNGGQVDLVDFSVMMFYWTGG